MSEAALPALEQLVREDEAHAAALAELDGLERETRAVRERAELLAALLDAAPREAERLAGAVREAEREEAEARAGLAEAEAEREAAAAGGDAERQAAARRLVVRARDALAMAERRLAAARGELVEHERRLAAARAEAPELEARAAALADALRGRPRVAPEAARRPGPGLDGVARWASGARAGLVVARGGIAAEREAVIRQANELASAVLGEPLVATSAAAIARRLARGREP